MTIKNAAYYQAKYQTFIKVWNSSNSVEHCKHTLEEEHGWYTGMDRCIFSTSLNHEDRLKISTIKYLENKMRDRGVQLKKLCYGNEPKKSIDWNFLREFSRRLQNKVTAKDIIEQGIYVDGFNSINHTAMVEQFNNDRIFFQDLEPHQIQNVADYLVEIPVENVLPLWQTAGKSPNINNVVAIHSATTTKGTTVSDYISSVLR